jgi:hypothetical protein
MKGIRYVIHKGLLREVYMSQGFEKDGQNYFTDHYLKGGGQCTPSDSTIVNEKTVLTIETKMYGFTSALKTAVIDGKEDLVLHLGDIPLSNFDGMKVKLHEESYI